VTAELIKLPITGAELDISTPEGAVDALTAIVEFQRDLNSVQRRCRDTLRTEADLRGQRTFEVAGHKIVVENPSFEREYDLTRLEDELLAAGLEPARVSELVTYVPNVDGTIIRQLEKHPSYKVVIDSCTLGVREKTRTVKVTPVFSSGRAGKTRG